jgi:arsenite-transporting ATPase
VTKAPFRFFGGKGGAGKTTCSAAAAVAAADRGRRVLVVSMDPAHSLGDALDNRLGARPRRVATRRGTLYAAELDADGALRRWLAGRQEALRAIAERGTYLDREDVDRFLGLSVPGVDELMGLVELFAMADARGYDEIVVDSAPTGHMLRLLEMPATLRQLAAVLDTMQEKHRVLVSALGRGRFRDDPAEDVIDELERLGREAAALLRDRTRSDFTWVLRPEALSLAEARDGIATLEGAGLHIGRVVVNGITPAPPSPCALCDGRRRDEARVLAEARREWGDKLHAMPALDREPRGVAPLLAAFRRLRPAPRTGRSRAPRPPRAARMAGAPASWLEALAPQGVRLLLLGGKGGVGKTSSAVVIADALVRAGRRRVLVLSADPAHSLGDVLDMPVGDREAEVTGARGLFARELDAAASYSDRREQFRRGADTLFDAMRGGSALDSSFDRAVARELMELAPPGIDELFAVLAVTDALARGPRAPDVVVLDTAPTGHALRLLALPDKARQWVQAFLAVLLKYREVATLGEMASDLLALSRDLGALGALLRDRARTAFVVVSRPGALPRLETERLLESLRALDIPVGGLIVNAVTHAEGCARCRGRAVADKSDVAALAAALRRRSPGAPLVTAAAIAPPPRGLPALRAWGNGWTMGPDAKGEGESERKGKGQGKGQGKAARPRRRPAKRPASRTRR